MAPTDPVPPSAGYALGIRLLGDLEVTRGGVIIPLPASKRTRALLGYLVGTAAGQSRQVLCDLLWDGPDDPRAALRWSLTKLLAVVDDAAAVRLVADRERVEFAAHGASVDIARVQQLLAAGLETVSLATLEEVARLFRGVFLGGLDLPVCYRFHFWCMAEREHYAGIRRTIFAALVDRLSGEPERALPYGRAIVAIDPLAESAHAKLVTLLAAAGRYPDAEQHYDYARELLRREVAAPAGGPLDDAIRQVRRQMRALSDARSADSAPGANSSIGQPERGSPLAPSVAGADGALADAAGTPYAKPHEGVTRALVGRIAERSAIDRAIATPAEANRGLLLFLGEPGIGKTRLLDHCTQTAGDAGYQVLRGRCYEAELVRPYGLWIDALRGVAADAVPEDTARRTAPLLAANPGMLEGEHFDAGGRERLFGAAAGLLRGLASVQPLALVLDDLQWLDEGSAALLHFLVRTLEPSVQVIFVGAARSGEIDDNPWAKGLLQSLARGERLRRLALAPLAEPEVAALLGPSISAIEPAVALRESGGNPLFVLELARAHGRDPSNAGHTLDALIAERLDALDDRSRELLAWAAAIGHELRPELLSEVTGIPVAELLARVDRLERRGLLKPASAGHFDFAHDLVRQAVYRALSQPRRCAIHRQIARQLLAASADDPRLHGELVHHASLGADPRMTAQGCLAAGEHCLRVFANAEAAAVAERGLAHVAQLPQSADRVRLTIGLLKLRVIAAATPGARRLPSLMDETEHAIEEAEALSLHAEAASGLHILSWLAQHCNDTERARTATLNAERTTRKADAASRCQQLANTGRCLLDVDTDLPRARELLAEAAALAASLDLKVIELMWGDGLLARVGGHLDLARTDLTRAVALAQLREDHWREYECLVWLAVIELERGSFDAVVRHAEDIVRVAQRMGDAGAPFAEALRALAELYLGRPQAQTNLAAGLEALRVADDKAHLAYALNTAAAMALDQARHDAAGAYAREALAAAHGVRRSTEVIVATAVLGQVAATLGDTPRADQLLGDLRQRAELGQSSARATAALERAERARRAIPTVIPTPAHYC